MLEETSKKDPCDALERENNLKANTIFKTSEKKNLSTHVNVNNSASWVDGEVKFSTQIIGISI